MLNGKEYLLDIEQAEKLGLLKEKDGRVKSWEEFINKHLKSNSFYCTNSGVHQSISPFGSSEQLTPHEAKALTAFSKLLKLRRDWIGDWEPDWTNSYSKYVLYRAEYTIRICDTINTAGSLSFPSYEMAQEFRETFRDLIEEAKILI